MQRPSALLAGTLYAIHAHRKYKKLTDEIDTLKAEKKSCSQRFRRSICAITRLAIALQQDLDFF